MWKPAELGRRRRSIGRDGLYADGVELAKTLDLSDWSDPPVNLEACEMCGSPDCGGAFVSPRRAGDLVLLMPPLDELAREIEEDRWPLYRPSWTVARHGVFVADEAALRRVLPELPGQLPPFTRDEAVRCLQMELDPLLGRFPAELRVDRERFVAGPGADLAADLDALDALLQAWRGSHRPVTLLPDATSEPLWFFADDRDVYPAARTPDGLRPRFEPGLVAT
ncbi:MAG: hypothetical protein VYE22_20015 [Myxococcota bacterium]|nr:hypothetical protein [Myxococcota bacterium]